MATTSETEPIIFDELEYAPPAFEPFRFQEWPRPDADWERVERDKAKIDPVTLDVIEGALESAIEEGEAAVERTGRSTIIREQHDYRASVNTMDCENVTHVSFAPTADPIRAYFSLEEINEGDVFLFNDVYESHGTITHLPDYCIVLPVLSGGRLMAFVNVMGHTKDVGGRVVGSWPIESRSIFEDGVQIPPVKYFNQGVRSDDIRNIVLRNTRFPTEEIGDVDAFLGAARIIERRIQELCDKLGTDLVEAGMYKLIDRCADTIRDAILPLIPDGQWVGEDFIDNDGINLDEPIKEILTLKKDKDKMLLDWTGTHPQTEGCINWPVGGRFLSKWMGAFLKQFAPGTVMNEGVTRHFRCYLPPGTFMSPSKPLGVANRMQSMLRNFGPYTVCLAQAFNGEVVADMHCVQVYGFFGDDEDGELFLYREVFGAGSGARTYADGTDAVDLVPQSKNLPAEFIEQRFPVIVERVGLSPDSGGPGKYRGGLGYLKEVRSLVDGHYLTNVDRTAFACFGVGGGGAGKPGGSWINPDTSDEQHVQFCREAVPVKAGALVRITTPGGGGWGDPLERDPEAVRLDVLRRLVSRESAERDYGVIVTEQKRGLTLDFELDPAATKKLRADLSAERGPVKLINRGEHADRLKEQGVVSFDEHIADDWRRAD